MVAPRHLTGSGPIAIELVDFVCRFGEPQVGILKTSRLPECRHHPLHIRCQIGERLRVSLVLFHDSQLFVQTQGYPLIEIFPARFTAGAGGRATHIGEIGGGMSAGLIFSRLMENFVSGRPVAGSIRATTG